jgi:hypothetical protein
MQIPHRWSKKAHQPLPKHWLEREPLSAKVAILRYLFTSFATTVMNELENERVFDAARKLKRSALLKKNDSP